MTKSSGPLTGLKSRLKYPIIQAPMAGGINTPTMTAAVCNTGCLGSFGFAYSSPQKIAEDILSTRKLLDDDYPINCNFFVFPVEVSFSETLLEAEVERLGNLVPAIRSKVAVPAKPYWFDLREQIQPVLDLRPGVVTFHFGIPSEEILQAIRVAGCLIGITATCLEEALKVKAAGADFVILQGIEAGGHRGTFETEPRADSRLGVVQLLETVKPHMGIDMVVAGGIMTGQDIRKFLEMGATAVQMGTAFVSLRESGASAEYKRALLESERSTEMTRAFSGRLARGIENAYIKGSRNANFLPFPIQNTITNPMRSWAKDNAEIEFQSLWAGTRYRQCRDTNVSTYIESLVSLLNSELISS